MLYRKLPYKSALFIALLAALAAGACKAPQAFGDRNSIIVRADRGLWSRVDSTLTEALEQRVFTTRPERKFEVTFVAADDTIWNDFRQWQQVVVVGTAGDEAVRRVLNAADSADVSPPAIVHASSLWARGQQVTALVLPEADQAEAVRSLADDLYALLDGRYQDWIRERMFTSGVDDSLSGALEDHGFTLTVPQVYLVSQEDSTFLLRNPYRQGDTDLLRTLYLTWRDGATALSPDSLRAWREKVDESVYEPPQDILDEGVRYDTLRVGDLRALEFRGVWRDRGEFPAAGPFVARQVPCPEQDRTYYMDGWLFAPGTDKYQYVRQLEIVMNSFRCVGGDAVARDRVPTAESMTSPGR